MFAIQVIKLVIDNAALEDYEKIYFAKHPKAKKKPIAHPYHESINTWMIMKRPMMNALKQRWKDFIVSFIQNSKYKDVHIEACELKFTTYYGTARRHDVDNSCPKFILDGLCESGFIVDDDSKHITSLTMQCFVDVDNPRTEIEVTVSKMLTNYKRPELKEEKPMAKKKINRISINALEEVVQKTYENTQTVEWNGIDVVINKSLSLEDLIKFADSVVKSCFNGDTGEYMPWIKDFAIRSNIMEMYANFTLPKNLEAQYNLVINSGAVEMILNHVNAAQFNELIRSIDAKIQNFADANVNMAFSKLNDVVASFDGLQEKMSSLFAGVDAADVSKLIGAISDGAFSEDAVVKAYMEQKQQAE